MKLNRLKRCECGCGQIVNNRFVSGHNGGWNKGIPCREETKKKLSYLQKEKCKDKDYRMMISDSIKTKWKNKKYANSLIEAKRKNWRDPKYAEMMSNAHKGQSSAMKGKHHTEEAKRKLSIIQKKKWQDSQYRESQLKAIGKGLKVLPNNSESYILNLLNSMYPGDWRYSGDFTFIINGKNPDFVNINGQKKCIELFGDYWHRNDNPQERKDIFKQDGWDTLVIWERELRDENLVRFRINKFMRKIS